MGALQLNAMLDTDRLKGIAGEDLVLYFKVVYTEPAGFNLRNLVSHGLADDSYFSLSNANLVLHTILALSIVLQKEI